MKEHEGPDMNRRQFLRSTASAAGVAAVSTALAPIASASGLRNGAYVMPDADKYDLLMCRVCDNNPDWDFGPGGDMNFLEEFGQIMRCKVNLIDGVRDGTPDNGLPQHFNGCVDLSVLESMRRFPVLFMMGTGAYRIPPARAENLKAYLEEGGFLLMDECASPRRADDFYNSALVLLQQMFPPDQIRKIPEDHEVYRNVYDISEPNYQRWKRGGMSSPGNTGVFIGDRLAVMLTDADIHCGWIRVVNGRANFEEGIKTGINWYTYALSH